MIPEDLKKCDNWLTFTYTGKPEDKRTDKVPRLLNGDFFSPVKNPDHKPHSYDEVKHLDNIGYYIPDGSKYTCIDFDKINEGKSVEEDETIRYFDSSDTYIELSPSKTGAHVWLLASPYQSKILSNFGNWYKVEIFSRKRFITMTNNEIGIPFTGFKEDHTTKIYQFFYTEKKEIKVEVTGDSDGMKVIEKLFPTSIIEKCRNFGKNIDRSKLVYEITRYYQDQNGVNDSTDSFLSNLMRKHPFRSYLGEKSSPDWYERYVLPSDKYTTTRELELPDIDNFKYLNSLLDRCSYFHSTNLSIGAILSCFSVIMGNSFYFENLYPNIYVITLASTGFGKQTYLNFIQTLLDRFRLVDRLGFSNYSSQIALGNHLKKSNSLIVVADEVGKIIGHIKSDTWASTFRTALLSLYGLGRNGKYFLTSNAQTSGKDEKYISNVCLSFYGTSNWKTVKDSIGDEDMTGGFLNRFIFPNAEEVPYPKRKTSSMFTEVAEMTDFFMQVEDFCVLRKNIKDVLKPRKIVTESDQVDDFFFKNGLEFQYRLAKGIEEVANPLLYQRVGANMKKISMILAFIKNPQNPIITLDMGRWSYNFLRSTYSTFETKIGVDDGK